MAVIKVNADSEGLHLDEAALRAALDRLAPRAPVVAMVHGFRFQPDLPGQCPHEHILALHPEHPDRKAISWPRHLGFGRPDGGLGLAFGWHSRGTLWAVHARAPQAGRALAELVALVRRIAPERQVDVIGHSLGARVALAALPQIEPGAVGLAILLSAAEFRGPAEAAMATEAGRAAQVLNVTTQANRMFDFLLEALLSGGTHASVSSGLSKPHPGWTDLRADDPAAVAALRSLGFRLGGTQAQICHWSPFLRPGLFRLYRALLERRLPLPLLRTALTATRLETGSRFLPPAGGAGLSLPGETA
ncbi:DUF726 domain-containing protein [Tabrizicola sp. J26]|uniref:DUF726 domain-containing protein n=1 Tax=Alitabrizicola rongguiensis TaxID=2909234 RepID=UPI001F450166|nr:DUF726 domain-containing protein [Tabrizicola rongguiensis]MCF1708528.1 DUF726 domain-containing protein [Tabrizicola rongguiensis]